MEELYNGTTSSSLTHIQLKSSKMGKMGKKNIWRNYGWIIYILDNTLKPQTQKAWQMWSTKNHEKTMPRDITRQGKQKSFQEPRSQPLLSPQSRANTILPTTCMTHLKGDLAAPTEATQTVPHRAGMSHPHQALPTCTFMSWAKDTTVLGHWILSGLVIQEEIIKATCKDLQADKSLAVLETEKYRVVQHSDKK